MAQLFRVSSLSFDPSYTQIRQVNHYTFVKCYLIELLLKILLLLIPLSLNLLYFPLCSTGGLLVARVPTLSLYLVYSFAPSHWVIPTLSLYLVDSLAPSQWVIPTLSLNPVVSLSPSHYPSPDQSLAFSFPAQMLLSMSFLLLFLLSFIDCT